MSSQYIPFIVILLVIMGVLYGVRIYRQVKKSAPEGKRKILKIYAVVLVVSIVLYTGITLANIPERMGWVQEIPPSEKVIEDYLKGVSR